VVTFDARPSDSRPTVHHVEVITLDDGALEVSWELVGDGPVELAVGPRPDAIDHRHPAARVEGTTWVTLRDLHPGRHYVSVAPAGGGPAVVAAERLVSLQRGRNFRDLGGYRTAGGGRVRWGLVYRSASLHRLTAADLTTLGRLGLRVVYDLRGEEERERAPSVLPDDVRCELLPIGGSAAKTKELTDLVLAGRLSEVPPDFLARIYDAMVDAAATTFGRLLTGLADPDGVPALFHCHAGKDRTGIVAALLLSLLGVGEDAVLDDYQLSGIHYTEHQLAAVQAKLAGTGVDVERYRAVFGTPRDAMATVLATLRERHGSVEAYLHDEAGVDHQVFAELRAGLVTSAAGS
jgi:protein-tyrosine phosphatase